MTGNTFDVLTKEQIDRSLAVLLSKSDEYATEDRLHNFRVAAALQGLTCEQALAGMMAKHTVSVYDMCWSGEDYPIELWEEKITDSINYLLLLNAMVRENVKSDHRGNAKNFQTGDFAKIIDCINFHNFPLGTVVKLTKNTTDYWATDSQGNKWYVTDNEISATDLKF